MCETCVRAEQLTTVSICQLFIVREYARKPLNATFEAGNVAVICGLGASLRRVFVLAVVADDAERRAEFGATHTHTHTHVLPLSAPPHSG